MKVGLVTYTPEKVEGFDLHVYYSKRADGSVFPAAREMQNDVTCFCDAKAVREDPSIVAVSENGPALRKNRKINVPFDFVCPTNPEYQARILDYVKGLGRENVEGVTLNLYHFPEEEFCVCPRCVELWRQSGLNWTEWRAQEITSLLREAKRRVKGAFVVDYFHVPLSARDYLTNYWVDLLARDFLKVLKKPVVVELSAEMLTDEKLDALLKTVAYLSRHDLLGVLLLVTDSENARQVCRYAVNDSAFRGWLRKYEFSEMARIVDEWAKLY
jgi:hypothetical protein